METKLKNNNHYAVRELGDSIDSQFHKLTSRIARGFREIGAKHGQHPAAYSTPPPDPRVVEDMANRVRTNEATLALLLKQHKRWLKWFQVLGVVGGLSLGGLLWQGHQTITEIETRSPSREHLDLMIEGWQTREKEEVRDVR